jgi:hypothetical protein
MSVSTVSDIVLTKNVTVSMGCLQTSDTSRSQMSWQATLTCSDRDRFTWRKRYEKTHKSWKNDELFS